MEVVKESEVIYGNEIFFNFIEFPYTDIDQHGGLIASIKNHQVDGCVIRDIFSEAEIDEVKQIILSLPEEQLMITSSGKLFPAPFATVSNSDDMLRLYFDKLDLLYSLAQKHPVVKAMLTRVEKVFREVGKNYEVSIPVNKIRKAHVAPGNFRMFMPDWGGLHVHCGNLFQVQSEHYYSLIENDIDKNDQLSYFVVMQNSESGGELTIYDMLWDNVKSKASPEENNYVIDEAGRDLYLKDVRSFSVRPKVGDILIFAGGPIWHRVENIKGTIPRITFGGFLNFSKDEKELFYWS